MTKSETIRRVNRAIDILIIKGKANSDEFKRLCRLHKKLISK